MRITKICLILLTSLFVLSGCTDKKSNSFVGYGYGNLFKNVTDNDLKLLGIDKFSVPNKVIKTCDNIDCFKEDFTNCNESQVNKDGIIYVIFGYNKDNKCKVLIDKTSANGKKSMSCLFNREDLTVKLFEKIIVRNDSDVNDNCESINLN